LPYELIKLIKELFYNVAISKNSIWRMNYMHLQSWFDHFFYYRYETIGSWIFWANFIYANLFFFSILTLTYTFVSPEFSRRKLKILKILNILILLLGLWVSIFGLKIFLLSLTIFINFTFIRLFVSMLILQKNCFSCLYFWV
jgi:hypothetical protein